MMYCQWEHNVPSYTIAKQGFLKFSQQKLWTNQCNLQLVGELLFLLALVSMTNWAE